MSTALLVQPPAVEAPPPPVLEKSVSVELLPFPAACRTDAERCECAYSTLEALRLRHNAQAALARAGKLKPAEFAAWKLAWWKPRQALAVDAVLAHRDKVVKPPKEDEDDKGVYQQAKAAWKASKRFPIDLDALSVAPAEPLPDPYQDLSAPNYTLVDPDGDVTIGGTGNVRATFDTMARNVNAHLTRDMGAGHFGDYEHDFDFLVSACSGTVITGHLWGVSNQAAAWSDLTTGQSVYWRYSPHAIYLRDVVSSNSDFYSPTLGVPYYCTAKRATTAGSCEIYDAPGRLGGDLLDTLTATVADTTYRYHLALTSANTASVVTISGYVENHDLHEAAGFVPYPRPINPDMTGGISQ
ncbi:MAG TPA: hypothetical protein VM695_09920 [Phycisphaerae bacterium]|nr:hypothetical protein [Phycisphaerae bacterium]